LCSPSWIAQGEARSFHVARASGASILPVVEANIAKEATIATDDARHYYPLRKRGRRHESVNHKQDEWARGPIHTNTVEGFFSIFKRGMKGTYQHCSEKHLHRYLAEFDFR
jgi:transposase-like protein